jgi:TfoX/Sxy family transcriptional regulator of competence genes
MKIKWEKATPELIAFFDRRMSAVDCERRSMFGYPCCFLNNNMFAGVYKDVIIVRLPEKERVQALAEHKGIKIFEPVPGRVMKEYLALPEKIFRDKKIFDELVAQSIKYVSVLPKKEKKKKK